MAGTDGVEDRILVLAPIGRDAAAIVSVLSRAGLRGEICPTLPDLIRSLDAGAGSAFIGEEALFVPEAELLISWIQQQPAWSDFPFILLTRSNSPAVLTRWRRGLLKNIPNVLLLERPADALIVQHGRCRCPQSAAAIRSSSSSCGACCRCPAPRSASRHQDGRTTSLERGTAERNGRTRES